jgi:hypothetical protein
VLAILKASMLPEHVQHTCIIAAAMPAAANTVIFAERYDGDSELASRVVGISTVFSILTIPIIMALL